ncbi:hypothetical protein DAI22_02g055050 [Oryza sativa Japonica Group]|nr:hypothetical protein DAI22_02g055050 [Oryza sativa Japonica Group]
MAGDAEDGDGERVQLFVGQVPSCMAEEEILAVEAATASCTAMDSAVSSRGRWLGPAGRMPPSWTARSGSTPPSPLRPPPASSLNKGRGKREKRREGDEKNVQLTWQQEDDRPPHHFHAPPPPFQNLPSSQYRRILAVDPQSVGPPQTRRRRIFSLTPAPSQTPPEPNPLPSGPHASRPHMPATRRCEYSPPLFYKEYLPPPSPHHIAIQTFVFVFLSPLIRFDPIRSKVSSLLRSRARSWIRGCGGLLCASRDLV